MLFEPGRHEPLIDAAWDVSRARDAVRVIDRARSFAMHAIAQQERMRKQYGRGRCTLWTGDPGVAVYAWHCLTGSGGMPGLEILD